jgi:hypothetical protein
METTKRSGALETDIRRWTNERNKNPDGCPTEGSHPRVRLGGNTVIIAGQMGAISGEIAATGHAVR